MKLDKINKLMKIVLALRKCHTTGFGQLKSFTRELEDIHGTKNVDLNNHRDSI